MSVSTKLALTALLVLLPAVAAAQDASELHAEGVYHESITGNLDKAIALYKRAIEGSSDASLVARATLRQGNCYRKLSQTDLARAAYQRVVVRFALQKDAVRRAKLALLTLGPGQEELKEWSSQLKTEVARLKSALEAVSSSIARIKSELAGQGSGSGKLTEEGIRAFEEMITREEMRQKVKRYLASHYFRSGVHAYRALAYERALADLRVAFSLQPDDKFIRGYLEKTEFILGRRASLTPAAINNASNNPGAQLLKELKAAYELAAAAKKEGDYRMALAAVEELLERARWTDDALVTDEVKKLLQDADSLAEECLIRLYPTGSRRLKMLDEERRELARKLKRKLDEVLIPPLKAQDTESILAKARELHKAGSLPEAKGLLEKYLAEAGENVAVRALLEEINRLVRREKKERKEDVSFSIVATAIALPADELGTLKIPFTTVRPAEGEGEPFACSVVSAKKGREILSAAALGGRDAVSKFPDMNVAPGQKGSRFLGSAMTYVSGYRRRPGAAGEYEPVKDIVFQGIKLSVTPKGEGGKVTLSVELRISVIVGEPRILQTEGGRVEIPQVYTKALKHTFNCRSGEYLIIGSFPNTLAPGGEKKKEDMHILLSPRQASASPEEGAGKAKPGK